MPNNIVYRTPNAQEEQIYNSSMGGYDPRPNRPNSIELRRSYPSEVVDGGYAPSSPHYHHQNNYQQQGLSNPCAPKQRPSIFNLLLFSPSRV